MSSYRRSTTRVDETKRYSADDIEHAHVALDGVRYNKNADNSVARVRQMSVLRISPFSRTQEFSCPFLCTMNTGNPEPVAGLYIIVGTDIRGNRFTILVFACVRTSILFVLQREVYYD